MTARVLFISAILCCRAAPQNVTEILDRFIAAQKANDEIAHSYTCIENAEFFTYRNGGPGVRKDRSEESELIFIEGFQYKKLILRNGKPLNAREQAEVDQSMKETAEYRRKHHPDPPPGGRINFRNDHADLGSYDELKTLFDVRLAGEEEVHGRKAWLIEAVPKTMEAANEHQREVLKFSKKLWIDQRDFTVLKFIYTVVDGKMFVKPGSTITQEYQKLPDGTDVIESVVLDVKREVGKLVRLSGRTEYRYSRFQKFDVQSSITPEP